MCDPEGILEWPVRTGDHDELVVFESWPGAVLALDHVDGEERVHRTLDSHAADLAFAHRVVAVANREQRAVDVDAEVDGGPGAGLGGVHVAAERLGHEHVARL